MMHPFVSFLFISGLMSINGHAQNSSKASHDVTLIGANIVPCLIAQNMEVVGHRGLDGYPNNTIVSFLAAFAAGADAIELDLQITKDNHLVVAHDAIPNVGPERCGVNGQSLLKQALHDLDYSKVQEIRCGPQNFKDSVLEPIPELSEVFAVFKNQKTRAGKEARIIIEIKYFPDQIQYYPGADQYLDIILKVIRENGWATNRFVVHSFNHDILKRLKARAPDIEVVPLVGDARNAESAATFLGATTVNPGFWQVTPELIFNLHKKNIKSNVWTPNTENEIKFVINSGADGIITDHTDWFYKIRDELCQ